MMHVMADGLPIGVRIARRRQALGMRQEDLARKLGVSKSSVANWESGKHFPKRKLGAVEAALGISLDAAPPDDPVAAEMEVLREAIDGSSLPPERKAHLERIVEEALRGERPAKRRQEPPARAG